VKKNLNLYKYNYYNKYLGYTEKMVGRNVKLSLVWSETWCLVSKQHNLSVCYPIRHAWWWVEWISLLWSMDRRKAEAVMPLLLTSFINLRPDVDGDAEMPKTLDSSRRIYVYIFIMIIMLFVHIGCACGSLVREKPRECRLERGLGT